MLNFLKLALRVSGNTLDDELNGYISACIIDLRRVGFATSELSTTDDAIRILVTLYCKWMLNYDGHADRYKIAYEEMRNGYSMCAAYNGEEL